MKLILKNSTLTIKTIYISDFTNDILNNCINSLTYKQKLFLNEYFYSIGSFGGQNEIWNKIELFYLPIISNSMSTSFLNLKTKVNTDMNNIYSIDNNGVYQSNETNILYKDIHNLENSSKFYIDENDISFGFYNTTEFKTTDEPLMFTYTKDTSGMYSGTICFGFEKGGNNRRICMFIHGPNKTILVYGINSLETNEIGFKCISSLNGKQMSYTNDYYEEFNNSFSSTNEERYLKLSNINSMKGVTNPDDSNRYGLFFIGKGLTENELKILKESTDKFITNFLNE